MKNKQKRYVLLTNPRTCIGCRACEVSCSFQHYKENNPARALCHIVKDEENSLDIPVICHHCDKAPCIEACPVQAITRDEDTDAVIIDQEKCIRCRTCISACPFHIIMVDPKTDATVKCDLCKGDPRCAKVCPKAAIVYTRRDLGSKLLMRGYTAGLIETLKKEMKPQES